MATVGSLIISALTTVVTGADLHVPLRPYLVLVALCVVPGVAAWARHPLDDPALWLTAVFATSITLSSATGLALVWSGHWKPLIATAVVSAFSTIALVSAVRTARRHERTYPRKSSTTTKGSTTTSKGDQT